MDGDALSILDCCMASTAGMKSRNGLPRTYQLLAASAADAPTCGPGQNSFTTALCASLTELLEEAKGGTFLLTQLCERINTKRTSQACLSWDRLRTFKRTVQLGRIEKCARAEESFINKDPELSSLILRLSFKTSDLDNEQIAALADHLPSAILQDGVPLRRIDWHRMVQTKPQMSRTPSIHHNVSCPTPTDDADFLGILNDGTFDTNTKDGFEVRPTDFHGALRAINAAQRWRSLAKRKHGSHCQIPEDTNITLSFGVGSFLIFKLFCVLFTFGLLILRGEKTHLVFCAILVAFMLLYGPCGMVTQGQYARRERGGTNV
jgi:hypothetical protein